MIEQKILIQLILILVILAVGLFLFLRRGARQEAIRRLLVLGFAIFAALTVLFPALWSRLAGLVGVGRGADLLTYATVVTLLSYMGTQQVRHRRQEERVTVLARRIAIDEARPPEAHRKLLATSKTLLDPPPEEKLPPHNA